MAAAEWSHGFDPAADVVRIVIPVLGTPSSTASLEAWDKWWTSSQYVVSTAILLRIQRAYRVAGCK